MQCPLVPYGRQAVCTPAEVSVGFCHPVALFWLELILKTLALGAAATWPPEGAASEADTRCFGQFPWPGLAAILI
jgi:hypothetical protein